MIKKTNRKGFTLVELIVVIAIIGVLAAVLIPTMLGYATQSQIASLNSTAADIKDELDYFFVEADTKGYGMLPSNNAVCEPVITVTNGVWDVYINESPLNSIFKSSHVTWTGAGSGKKGDVKNGKCGEELIAITLADSFPDIQTARIEMRLEAGRCAALYFTTDTNTAINMQTFGNGGWSAANYAWNGNLAGLNDEGYYVGTAPVLPLD